MFVVLLTYKVELGEVEAHLGAHVEYLKKHYASGLFLVSGAKVPRNGGVIIATAESKVSLDAVLAEDPFAIAGIADYEVVEFAASMFGSGLEDLDVNRT